MDYSRKVIFSILAVALLGSMSLAYAASLDFVLSFPGTGTGGGGDTWSDVTGIATDSNNRILVADLDDPSVQIYDSAGNFVLSFDGSDGAGVQFSDVRRIAVNSTDHIFVVDGTLDKVQIYDSTGSFIAFFNGLNGSGTVFTQPDGIAIDSNDRILVGDIAANTVQIFDQGGFFLSTFDGTTGGGTGFQTPSHIATDSANRIIVGDAGFAQDAVQIFDSTGSFLSIFTGTTGGGTAFTALTGVAFDSNDRILVTDGSTEDTVQIFDSAGSFLSTFDGSQGAGTAFAGPIDITVDSNGRILVVDNNLLTVQIYEGFVPSTAASSGGGSADGFKTRPTFGLDHNSFRPLVEGGFSFNGVSHDITDNWWTQFAEQKVKIGTTNSFTAKAYADKQLRVQEFLFGIPNVGDAHKAELGIEIVYDYSGEIDRINVIQKTDIIDIDSIKVIHSKSKCQSDDTVKRCDTTRLSMKFLEPLQDKIMAIKAIDFKGRVHITYLNEGFDISGNSLNPMNTMMIPGTEKSEGLIEVTQTAKYSDIWSTQDNREFEMNESGSFKQINQSFERHIDTGVMKNRLHSGFADYKNTQAYNAIEQLLDYCPTCLDSFIDFEDSWSYEFPEQADRIEKIIHLIQAEQQRATQVLIDAELATTYPDAELDIDDRPISVILEEERYMKKFLADERAYLKQVLAPQQ